MDMEEIRKDLEGMLSPKRYAHSLGTEDMAVFLAERHDCDCQKVRLASLLHDCAKDLTFEIQKDYIIRYGVVLDEIEMKTPGLWHAAISQALVRDRFDIWDLEILHAIRIHPTGDMNMTYVDKIVILSDYLEPNRGFIDNKEIKDIAMDNLDQALFMVLTSKLLYVIKKGTLIHPRVIEARNGLLSLGFIGREGIIDSYPAKSL